MSDLAKVINLYDKCCQERMRKHRTKTIRVGENRSKEKNIKYVCRGCKRNMKIKGIGCVIWEGKEKKLENFIKQVKLYFISSDT